MNVELPKQAESQSTADPGQILAEALSLISVTQEARGASVQLEENDHQQDSGLEAFPTSGYYVTGQEAMGFHPGQDLNGQLIDGSPWSSYQQPGPDNTTSYDAYFTAPTGYQHDASGYDNLQEASPGYAYNPSGQEYAQEASPGYQHNPLGVDCWQEASPGYAHNPSGQEYAQEVSPGYQHSTLGVDCWQDVSQGHHYNPSGCDYPTEYFEQGAVDPAAVFGGGGEGGNNHLSCRLASRLASSNLLPPPANH
jgi:hypothetical protein